MDAEPFTFRHQGRNRAALYSVFCIWIALIAALILLNAALWLMLLLGAFTLPAIWELYRNPQAGLDLSDDGIEWFTGPRTGDVPWTDLDRVRLDTRLDFSVRASLVLNTGRKIRLPFECTPDHKQLEAALNQRGIRTERHHFSLIG